MTVLHVPALYNITLVFITFLYIYSLNSSVRVGFRVPEVSGRTYFDGITCEIVFYNFHLV